MKITFYGHAGIKIEDDLVLLIDPWLNDNPLATMKAEDITKADYIIATHNHFDHINDIPIIAQNTGATVVGIVETVEDLASKGCKKTIGCNKKKKKNITLIYFILNKFNIKYLNIKMKVRIKLCIVVYKILKSIQWLHNRNY